MGRSKDVNCRVKRFLERNLYSDTHLHKFVSAEDYKKCLKMVNQTIINLMDRVSTI
jgi:hypothetical protein